MFKLKEIMICTIITLMYNNLIHYSNLTKLFITQQYNKLIFISKMKEGIHNKTQNNSIIKLKKYAKLIIKDEIIRSKKIKIFDLLSETSKDFLCSLDPTTGKIEKFLSNVVNELQFSRGYLYKLDKQKENFILRHKYDENYPLFTKKISTKTSSSILLYDKLKLNKPIVGPSDITNDILFLKNSKSMILIPINVNNVCTGFIGFDTLITKEWDEIEIDSLVMLSEFFGAWCLLCRKNKRLITRLSVL